MTTRPGADAPPRAVIAAFGAVGDLRRLPGGKGGTWRTGDVVLKPSEGVAESRWRAETLGAVPASPEFRVARPVRTLDGRWLALGWEAWRVVVGEPDPGRVDDVLRAGGAFHTAVAHLPRPAFLDVRDDPWSYGDRVAWEELPIVGCPATLELLEPLADARRPVDSAAQVVHGDLLGNVLFADGMPPAIIDWSPYWRPPAWAAAVAVVDALCWYGASPDVVGHWAHLPEWGQMLIRALIYRITTRESRWGAEGPSREPNRAYQPVITLAVDAVGPTR